MFWSHANLDFLTQPWKEGVVSYPTHLLTLSSFYSEIISDAKPNHFKAQADQFRTLLSSTSAFNALF